MEKNLASVETRALITIETREVKPSYFRVLWEYATREDFCENYKFFDRDCAHTSTVMIQTLALTQEKIKHFKIKSTCINQVFVASTLNYHI